MIAINKSLNSLRCKIDVIDLKIQQLLEQRGNLAIAIGGIKSSKKTSTTYYCPEREITILNKIKQRNKGPFNNQTLENIFKAILRACLTLQEKNIVTFLGPIGTYSHLAAINYFDEKVQYVIADNINTVITNIIEDKAKYAVLPVHNSITGIIQNVWEILITQATITIVDAFWLPIQHCLLTKLDHPKIKTIYAHEQAFLQCNHWLINNYPTVKKVFVDSNALAAQLAAKDLNSAAIASEQAAEIYQLNILASAIADCPNNQTKFLVVGKM